MIQAAEEVLVVTDSSKLGHSALAHLCPLETVDHLVVDSGITPEWERIVRDAGVSLTVV
jgi:DeoR/GlpR family transcriptional regulator of sugar metabolism